MEPQALGWLNQNTLRAYPLVEQAVPSLLGYDVIVDALVVVPTTVQTVAIGKLFLTPGSVAVTLVDHTGLTIGVVTSVVPSADFITGMITPVQQPLVAGTITFGPGVNRLLTAGYLGLTTFTVAEGTLESSCLTYIETTAVVTGLRIGDRVVTGDVMLKAGSDIELRVDRNNNAIVMTLNNTDRYVPPCHRANSCNTTGCFGITNINGVTPDVNGVITIIGDGVLLPVDTPGRLTLETPKLRVNDLCPTYTYGPTGDPGPTGGAGGGGGAGVMLCDTDDCRGLFPPPCPTECQEIIPKPSV